MLTIDYKTNYTNYVHILYIVYMGSIHALVCAFIISSVSAHSWLECSNYDPLILDYNANIGFERLACSGYPRGFARQYESGFGAETGYEWSHSDCSRDKFNNDDYTSTTPMATYFSGQTVYLAHPAKTHVADICTSSLIPSTSITLSISNSIGVDTFDSKVVMVGKDHTNGQIDHAGYQYCFDFCANPDKALCITGWVLPENITRGIHSFKWTWEFNKGEYYSSCFDAMVLSMNDIDASGSMSGSMSGSVSGSASDNITRHGSLSSDNETITFPPPTAAPTKPVDKIIEIKPIPMAPPQVITNSAATRGSSPITNISQYLINFIGNFSVKGFINITKISQALVRL